jgi:acetylornithine deacetylase/succinyl-diaminopimelate desuccinylase-like protein
MSQLDDLAHIGCTPDGGITRLAFSHEDFIARKTIVHYMKDAGLDITIDTIGNIIGKITSKKANAPIIATGSHIDTVINAGIFDGVLGILSSIECARIIRQKVQLNFSLEVYCFVMEESSRFGGVIIQYPMKTFY